MFLKPIYELRKGSFYIAVMRERCHRQDAVGVTHRPVKRQFADDERAGEIGLKLFGCHQQSDGDGQIVAQASRFHASGGNLVGTWTRIAAGPTSGH